MAVQVQLPNFVTKEKLQEILRHNFNAEIVVNNFSGEWGTNKGDNYASEMYRIRINYTESQKNKTKCILLKVCHGMLRDLLLN